MTNLDHEQFEGAKVLAEIGTKIATGRATLVELERSKDDFLAGREADAIARVSEVLAQSKELIAEIGNYHDELVGYSREVDAYLADLLYLIQSVERWKEAFDKENSEKLVEINTKIAENKVILDKIQQNRSLLEGESAGIVTKRKALREETRKINDEWATLGRAAKEINSKK